jgi:hypothetical protein
VRFSNLTSLINNLTEILTGHFNVRLFFHISLSLSFSEDRAEIEDVPEENDEQNSGV